MDLSFAVTPQEAICRLIPHTVGPNIPDTDEPNTIWHAIQDRQDPSACAAEEQKMLRVILLIHTKRKRCRPDDDTHLCFEVEAKYRLPIVKSPVARNIFHRWIEFPPECINVSNYVTRARLSEPIDIRDFVNKYPFCEIKTNWRSISLSSRYPFRKASIHPSGLINFSGDSNFRIARAVADRYLKMIQECGYPNIKITNFRVVNLTCMMDFPFSIDVNKWHKSNKDSIKFKGGFVGVRQQKLASTLASGASITVFKDKVNVVGTWNEHVVCYDIMRQYEKYKDFKLEDDGETAGDGDSVLEPTPSQNPAPQPKRSRVVRTTNRNYKKLKIT